MASPRLAVILINYDNEEDTIACLETLAEQTYDEFLTIVIDNGSTQESYEKVRDSFKFPTYIRNDANLGFTGGNNVGIEYALDAGVEYVFLLNNDTEIEATLLADLLAAAEELPDEAGVVGPTIHTYGSREVWAAGGNIEPLTGVTSHRTEGTGTGATSETVDYIVGAALLVRAEVFRDIGLLDDDFFIYYEETEFCHRARSNDWDVWHVPVTGVYHKETNEFEHSTFRDYYFTRNRIFFERKTQPIPMYLLFVFYASIRWAVVQSLYLGVIVGQPDAAKATLRGYVHGLSGVAGKRH